MASRSLPRPHAGDLHSVSTRRAGGARIRAASPPSRRAAACFGVVIVLALAASSRSAADGAAPTASRLPPQERLPLGPRANAPVSAGGDAASSPARNGTTAAGAAATAATDGAERDPSARSALDGVPELLAAPRSTQASKVPATAAGDEPVAASAAGASAAGASTAAAGSAPVKGSSPANASTSSSAVGSFASSWFDKGLVLSTLLPVALLAVVAVALRGVLARGAGRASRPSGVLEILARYPVGRGQSVALLRVGRRVVVVHQADRSMTTLCETSDPDEVADLVARSRDAGRDSFARLLARRRDAVDPFEGAETVDLTAPSASAPSPPSATGRPTRPSRERTLTFRELRG